MRIDPRVFATPEGLGEHAARGIADRIDQSAAAGRPFVLGCPSGRSALRTYQALAREVRRRDLDLSGLVLLMMDEYLVEDGAGGLQRVEASLPHSCLGFGRREIVEPLNAAARAGREVAEENLWQPDPDDPDDYERRISDRRRDRSVPARLRRRPTGMSRFNPAGTELDSAHPGGRR